MALGKWENFFMQAGIPSAPAKSYAIKFSDNRIRLNMLNELSKEILHDLGITVMGDVIAILRHSKKVFEQIQRDQADDFDIDDEGITGQTKMAVQHSKHEAISDKGHKQATELITASNKAKPVKKDQLRSGRKTLSARFSEQDETFVPQKKAREVKELTGEEDLPFGEKAKKNITLKPAEVLPIRSPESQVKKVTVIPAKGEAISKKDKHIKPARLEEKAMKCSSAKTEAPSELGGLKPLKAGLVARKSLSVSSSIFSRLGEKQNLPSSEHKKKQSPSNTAVAKARTQGIFKQENPLKQPKERPESNVFRRLGEKQSCDLSMNNTSHTDNKGLRLGLSNSHSVLRKSLTKTKPTEYVKPVVRTAKMDSKAPAATSVFSRLGKR